MAKVVAPRYRCGPTALVVCCAMGVGACSFYVESSREQCESDADCTSRGTEFAASVCVDSVCQPTTIDPTWACLGSVEWPQPPARQVQLSLAIVDLVTTAPFSGVTARACEKLDVACDSPLTADVVSDASGVVTLSVPAGFDGYLELRGPQTQPALVFLYPPVLEDGMIPPVPLFTPQDFAEVAAAGGNTLLPDHGHVFLGARNCLGEEAEGVSFSSNDLGSDAALFYLIADLPSSSATATDGSGRAGFINVDPGFVVVTGTRAGTSQRVSEVSLLTRAGEITVSSLVPSP